MAARPSSLRRHTGWIAAAAIPLWFLLSWFGWFFFRSPSLLDVVVYDATVPDDRFIEHASLAYLFDHEKIFFDVTADYVGAAPGGEPHGAWPEDPPDLLVLADAYGVYVNEAGAVSDTGRRRVTERLESADADRILEWVAQGTFVVGEFNIFEDPTLPAVSEALQAPFGVDPIGWTGKYFQELGLVPSGLKTLTGTSWDYQGPGILFVSGPAGDRSLSPGAVVLTGKDLGDPVPQIVGRAPNRWATVEVPFYAWFEVTEPLPGTQVDAVFEIDVSVSGAALLESAGIPSRFPALVHTDVSMYFAGDGLEVDPEFPLGRFLGGPRLLALTRGVPEERFFRKLYLPALQWAVDQAAD